MLKYAVTIVLFISLISLISLISCTHIRSSADVVDNARQLEAAITSLSSSIHAEDAKLISQVLVTSTAELAQGYRMTNPPQYHNFLVKLGIRERGLCCHWAKDLYSRIQRVNQGSVQFDWLVAKHGSLLSEHNTLVIYAENSSWQQGMVYDPWRKAGWPYWVSVKQDKYPWRLHPLSGQWDLLHCK